MGELRDAQLLDGTTPKQSGLDIAAIIQTFYQQDRASVTGHCRTTLSGSSLTSTTGHTRWPEMSNDVSGIMPSVDLMMPLGVDYAEGLDDILSLATHYLN